VETTVCYFRRDYLIQAESLSGVQARVDLGMTNKEYSSFLKTVEIANYSPITSFNLLSCPGQVWAGGSLPMHDCT